MEKRNVTVLVGARGRGSNLMALHTAMQEDRLPAQIVLVIGTVADSPAFLRARQARLNTAIVDPRGKEEEQYTAELENVLKAADTDIIALAGYMRRLPASIVAAHRHRVLNIHPSLLPSFGGKGMYGEHVHKAVLAYGAKVSGCTVHLVDEAYDSGPIILQRAVPVVEGDTPETLAQRVAPEEHIAFVEAMGLLLAGCLEVDGRIVRVRPVA